MDIDWNAELVDQLEWHWQHQLLRQLDDGHDSWVSDVRNLGAAGLIRPQGALSPPQFADAPMAKLILYTNLEGIHHGAEICLLRDLYLRKESRDCP